MSYLAANTMFADGLAPLGARTSAGPVMNRFGSSLNARQAPYRLTHSDNITWDVFHL